MGRLRCEYLENPEGIDLRQPRLSWVIYSTVPGQRQTAYQVLVASSLAKLHADVGDLWDSGKVESDQSIHVRYAGRPLQSHQVCYWKVRVWDKDGRPTPWSKPARWSMGMLEPSDWKAKWIGLDGVEKTNWLSGTCWIWYPVAEPHKAAPPGTNFFRRLVRLPPGRKIKSAIFQYAGDDECRGWLNGRDLGARRGTRNVKYNDITGRLEPGTTYVFGLSGVNAGVQASPAGVVGLIEIEFADGERIVIPTDEQWKASDKEYPGWSTPEFDDSAWVNATNLGPVGIQPWGNVRTAEDRRLPARWLRKEFVLTERPSRAVVYYSGLGLSELYLNGRKVGDHVLSPALSDYSKRVFYVTFDVTARLRPGTNALGVVLGGGRYYADRSRVYAGTVSYGFPKLLLQLRIEHADGSVTEIISDESWKLATNGPILINSEFDGEYYDARNEFDGWSEPGFDDSRWLNAQLVPAPAGKLAAQLIEPIRVTQTLNPVAVTEPEPGVFIFDMGQNMVGWCKLRVRAPAGTTITLRHAETLKPDGTLYTANLRGAKATDTYVCKGRGLEVYEPRFTYHGFRYVEVRGYPGRPGLHTIQGRVVHDDLPPAGAFECSHPLLNRLYSNVVWGVRGNYRSIPTDCPQRDERQGWLGDRSEESRGEAYLFNNAAFYAKWLQDIADAQRESGSIPDVAPPYWPIYNDDVTWPSTAIIIPNTLYRQFADTDVIARQYAPAKKWIEYMLGFVTNGIISKDSYGDWCVPPEDPVLIHTKDTNRITSKALLATAYFYYDLRLMQKYATMLGKTNDAARFAELAEVVKAAFNREFLDRRRGRYDNGTQTSCVLPLAFGLVPDECRSRVFAHLVEKIETESKGHIGTGLIGAQYLMRVLSDHGRPDLAFTIATQVTYPSWGYMISKGATTIWELWNGDTADPAMNSHNHVMLVGDLVVWLFEYLAGIAPDETRPGFKHIIMKPHPVEGLTFVRATLDSPYGLISSHWRKTSSAFVWRITIPPNTTATAFVPGTDPAQVRINGKQAGRAQGVRFIRTEHDRVVFSLVSGTYRFSVN
ncbi:MAG: glycoside hydrolase family 78 protein [Verrucomicrobiae bacterium]|nr:glycoside hydrolase family 78 protein [Verrucomicrobiae bacterium]